MSGIGGMREGRKPTKYEQLQQNLEIMGSFLEEVVGRMQEMENRLTFLLVKGGYARIATCLKCETIVCQALNEETGEPDDPACPGCGKELIKAPQEEEE